MNLLDRYRGSDARARSGRRAGKSTSFEHGALLAVNLGDDADTTGAVYGQIAGAYYGVEGIPERWRSQLARLSTLERIAEGLLRM